MAVDNGGATFGATGTAADGAGVTEALGTSPGTGIRTAQPFTNMYT